MGGLRMGGAVVLPIVLELCSTCFGMGCVSMSDPG